MKANDLIWLVGILFLFAALCMGVLDYSYHFLMFLIGVLFCMLGAFNEMKEKKEREEIIEVKGE